MVMVSPTRSQLLEKSYKSLTLQTSLEGGYQSSPTPITTAPHIALSDTCALNLNCTDSD